MSDQSISEVLKKYTLEYYESEFAEQHLVHSSLEKWAREKPDQLAIIDFDTERELTYQELENYSTKIALELCKMGFQRGDFLATHLPLTIEHIALEYACFKIGVIHAPVDLRLKAPEVVRSLDLIKAKCFVFLGKTDVADFGKIAQAVQKECPYVKHFMQLASPGEEIEGSLSFETFLDNAAETTKKALSDKENSEIWKRYEERHSTAKPTDGAQVIYTTGSTGYPKPALLSHRNLTAQNMCMAAGFNTFGGLRMLMNLPPSHVGCQGEALMTTFFTGGTGIILHVYDPVNTLEAIQKYQVEMFGQIPAMFNMQWRLPNYSSFDLSSVGSVLFGGQQVTEQFVNQLFDMVPQIATGLGLTEMAGFVTYSGLKKTTEGLVDSVGFPAPITPLTIRKPMNEDGTAGEVLPDGETGEICFSGPQVFIEYVNNKEAYEKTVTKEGVCYTGDLGAMTEKGLLFKGRSKLVIKPKGYQIHPAQLENHFAGMKEDVNICGAVGAPHDIFTEGIVLFLEKKEGSNLDFEKLKEHAKGIAAYMRPSHYVIYEPGDFPLNRISKTDYVTLHQLAIEETNALREAGGWDQE